MNTNEKAPPSPANAAPTNQQNQKRSPPHEIVKPYHQQIKPLSAQTQSPAHKPTHNPIPQTSGKQMSDSNEDSPGMDFINNMVKGQEELMNAAVAFSIVVWPDGTSSQNIEGFGGGIGAET